MKRFIITIILLMTFVASSNAWSFGKKATSDPEVERRVEAEARSTQLQQQLNQQRDRTEKWQIATGGFAIGCVVLLGIGTALGAKVRRDAKKS
jgi:anaerobic C4-dicarboxylate transporter